MHERDHARVPAWTKRGLMYHRPVRQALSTVAGNRFAELRRLVADNRDGLSNAEELIAGSLGARLVAGLVVRFEHERDPSRRTWQRLRDPLGVRKGRRICAVLSTGLVDKPHACRTGSVLRRTLGRRVTPGRARPVAF